MTDRRLVPHSTYRLQLNADFTFADATALVPYLEKLGVSHAYLSPILKAQPGSTHGYDTVDHYEINPELGTLDDFRALARSLQAAGMGIVLDFVPNHMGVGGAHNGLWLDVLREGANSRYADWFDIDWASPIPGLAGKLLMPFLGMPYAEALASGEIVLKADGETLSVWAHGAHKLPLRPEDERTLIAEHGSAEEAAKAIDPAALGALIAQQHWRLAHHSTASDEINYRRFFINSELGGIRIEKPEVFDHAHALIFALIEEELVDGLRIDHIDGLADPKGYLEALRAKTPRPIYLLIEKILAPHERLRADWPVDGTTGYEFGALLTRVLMHAEGEAAVSATYDAFVGATVPIAEEAHRCKLRVMDTELAAELFALARLTRQLAHQAGATRDLTKNGLRKGLREIIAAIDVYRIYGDDQGLGPFDRRELALAIARARRNLPALTPAVFDFLEAVLGHDLADGYDPALAHIVRVRFSQYTGPVMAKGLEDTALYRDNRLVALNEVGAHPDRFSIGVAAFHDANRARLADSPVAMLTTSTHDTKRGEDTRARIAAIADKPDIWDTAVRHWGERFADAGIDPNELYLVFQLLLGGWSFGEVDRTGLGERIGAAMVKSLREARLRSDWAVPDTAYEERVSQWVAGLMIDDQFMAEFTALEAAMAPIGRRKGLIQAALKLTVPGVPDIYRGAEDWEQSFVDPDNRRALDFGGLGERLDAVLAGAVSPIDAKLDLTARLLGLRKANPDLFIDGSYEPLDMPAGWLGFVRAHKGQRSLVLADLRAGHEGTLDSPLDLPTGRFVDVVTGESLEGQMTALPCLTAMGVCVLFSEFG